MDSSLFVLFMPSLRYILHGWASSFGYTAARWLNFYL